MSFDEALLKLESGERVCRLSWEDEDVYLIVGYNQFTGQKEILIKTYIQHYYGGYEVVYKTYSPTKECHIANDWCLHSLRCFLTIKSVN